MPVRGVNLEWIKCKQLEASRKQISFFFLGVNIHICAAYTLLYMHKKRRKQLQQNHTDETYFHSDIIFLLCNNVNSITS